MRFFEPILRASGDSCGLGRYLEDSSGNLPEFVLGRNRGLGLGSTLDFCPNRVVVDLTG